MSTADRFIVGHKKNACKVRNLRRMQATSVDNHKVVDGVIYTFRDGSKLSHRTIVDEMKLFKPATNTENMIRESSVKLTIPQVLDIKLMLLYSEMKQYEIATFFDVSESTISNIKLSLQWAHIDID